MKVINLLPKEDQRAVALESVLSRVILFWIVVIISLVVFLLLILSTKIYLDRNTAKTDAEIAQSQDTLNSDAYKNLQLQVAELNGAVREINNLKAQHYYLSNTVIALANLIPPTVQLNQVSFDRETGRVDIIGQAKTRDDIIELWSRVIRSDFFHGINFPLANLERAAVANFTFTFFVNKDKLLLP
ncbi:MAG: PilN domain-containing protein [Candidatus Doudnabacteria bacterium]